MDWERFHEQFYKLLPSYFPDIDADKRQTERLAEFFGELVSPLSQELAEMQRRADNAENRVVTALRRGLEV